MAVDQPKVKSVELSWRSGDNENFPPCPESYEKIVQGILGLKRAGMYHLAALRVAEIDAEKRFESEDSQ